MRRSHCQTTAAAVYRIVMRLIRTNLYLSRLALLVGAFCCLNNLAIPSFAQPDKDPAAPEKPHSGEKPGDKAAADKDKDALPPLPAEAHADQTIELNGKTLHYTVTVGALPTRDADGKVAG